MLEVRNRARPRDPLHAQPARMPQLRTGNWDRARMTLQPSWSVPTTLTRTIPAGRTRDCRGRNGRRGCSRHSNIWLLPRKGPATTAPTDRIPGHHRGGSVPTRYKWLISNPSLTGAGHRPSVATEASPAVNTHRLGQPKCPTGYGIAHRSRNAGWGCWGAAIMRRARPPSTAVSRRLRKSGFSATGGVPCAWGEIPFPANTVDLRGCHEHNAVNRSEFGLSSLGLQFEG